MVPTIGSLKRQVFAASFTGEYAFGEFLELIEAVREGDIAHVREEWSDVCLCTLAWLSEYIPLDWMPVLPGFGLMAARKFTARRAVWREIFDVHGVEFANLYLSNGGNYRKRHKVIKALALVGVSEEQVQWEQVSVLTGGFEG